MPFEFVRAVCGRICVFARASLVERRVASMPGSSDRRDGV